MINDTVIPALNGAANAKVEVDVDEAAENGVGEVGRVDEETVTVDEELYQAVYDSCSPLYPV